MTGICGAFAAWVAARATRKWFAQDADNAFAIHGVGGIAGALTLPLFSLPFFGAGLDGGQTFPMQFTAQAIATAVVVLWTGGVTMVVALMVTMIVPMQGTTAAKD